MAKRCTSNPVGVYSVDSDTSTKIYTVAIRENGKHTCDCTGFVTKRNKFGGFSALGNPAINCKHVKAKLQTQGCGWTSETGAAQTYPNVCPDCQDLTEDYFEAPAVIDDTVVDDTITALLKTRERMQR